MHNPPPEKTMAPFSFSMIALGRTTEQDVRDVLGDLDLGVLDSIHRRDLDDGRAQFFVHYASASVIGTALAAQLANVEKRQKDGEVDVWPKRIEYGFNEKTQKTVYWQIYKTATKAERAAASKANTAVGDKIKARLV
jgi:hypothetical protein